MHQLKYLEGVWYLSEVVCDFHIHHRIVDQHNIQDHIDELHAELRKALALQKVLADRAKDWGDS